VQSKRRSRTACILAGVVVLLAVAAEGARAQGPVTLTLEEAIELARRNNPAFRMLANDESEADWRVREAYAALLPTSSASLAFQYEGEGQPLLDLALADLGVDRVPESYWSSYRLAVNYQLSAERLFRPGVERANRESTVAAIEAAARTLELDVTRQYLSALRAMDAVELATKDLESARENEELALARARVGAGTQLEVKQAEVERGRAEVALLEAEHRVRTERLRLLQLLGIQLDRDLVLTSEFEVFEPTWDVDELVAEALGSHPQIRSLRAAEAASNAMRRAAWGEFLPSLALSVGWSGFSREVGTPEYLIGQARNRMASARESCELLGRISAGLPEPLPGYPMDCAAAYTLTPADEAAIVAENDVFPFEFTRQPVYAQLQVSIPLFSGFQRRRQVEAARVAADDARQRLRAAELERRTMVAEALLTLETAYRRVSLEERNASAAAEQLRLARQRYRLGAGDFLELSRAEADNARANRDHLAAVYSFHEALVALEAAVGRPLRGPSR